MRVTAKNILKDKVKGIVKAHSTVDYVHFATSQFFYKDGFISKTF